ncbi:fred, partial [Drosophila busckii]
YPRVEVGPQNPLRIERDHVAKLDCRVDAKPKVSNVRWSRNGQYVSATTSHTIYRVGRHHAGKYTCSADNGLGKTGEKDIMLDVLYAPIVTIESKTHEAEEGETVLVKCNVTANPAPMAIEWLKEGATDFRYAGEQLTLVSVRAEHAGNYICRSVNLMQPYNSKRIEGVGNSTVALLVRHRPGQAYITPNKPVVHVGNGVTLSCSANPPGWPVPQYRWFRDLDGDQGNTQKILAQGPQYSIPKAHLGSEGKYHCHAVNELGIGKMATIALEVHQPPQFLAKLQQHMTRRVGDVDYAVTCSAKAKPAPQIRWIKDGTEILAARKFYEIRTTPTDAGGGVVTMQSVLRFRGKARPNGNQLLPSDRGVYSCLYENDVNSANSSMHLRIEHEPIVLHQYNKVAYDLRESAEVICKVQAYPKPEFQWQFGNNPSPLTMSSDGHYELNTRMENNDIYISILRIAHLQLSDYGDYTCRAVNPLDTIRTQIRLQPKGAPEKPTALKILEVGHNYAVLNWQPGFNGGISTTKYLVSYRRVSTPREQLLSDCSGQSFTPSYQLSGPQHEWIEFNCFRENPCKLAPLDQHQSYMFKVYAFNSKGNSGHSNEVLATTKVNKIPPPLHVSYDPNSHVLGINVAATCLSLIAVVESLVSRDTTAPMWEIVETLTLLPSGNEVTFKEAIINQMARSAHYTTATSSTGRSASPSSGQLGEDRTMALAETAGPGPVVRVKLCLLANHEHCGAYANAEIGKSYMGHSSVLSTSAMVAIIIAAISFVLFLSLLYAFCRCRRTHAAKKQAAAATASTLPNASGGAKEYDVDATTVVAPSPSERNVEQTQSTLPPPPPPYYPTGSLDSKQLDGGMELTLTALHDPDEQLNMQQGEMQYQAKAGRYGQQQQNGYGYHVTSALGVDSDSYQVLPSSAAAAVAAGHHGEYTKMLLLMKRSLLNSRVINNVSKKNFFKLSFKSAVTRTPMREKSADTKPQMQVQVPVETPKLEPKVQHNIADQRAKWMAKVSPEMQRKAQLKAKEQTTPAVAAAATPAAAAAAPPAWAPQKQAQLNKAAEPKGVCSTAERKSWMNRMQGSQQQKQAQWLNDMKAKQQAGRDMQQQKLNQLKQTPVKAAATAAATAAAQAVSEPEPEPEPEPKSPERLAYLAAVKQLNSYQLHEPAQGRAVVKAKTAAGQQQTEPNIELTLQYLKLTGYELEQLTALPVIQVAGTKGRGSTCALVESILRAHSVRTGVLTAPHLFETKERIRIDGQPLDEQQFSELWQQLLATLAPLQPPPVYNKLLTVLAFHAFRAAGVEVAIVEIGAACAADCTNITSHARTIGISTLGWEASFHLSNSMRDIAWAKAAIMKPESSLYTSASQPECCEVLGQRAKQLSLELHRVPPYAAYIEANAECKKQLNDVNFTVKLNASLAIQLAYDYLRRHKPEYALGLDHNSTQLTPATLRGLSVYEPQGMFQFFKHDIFNIYLDSADTLESMMMCREWFYTRTRSSRSSKVLLFSKVNEFNAKDLLTIISHNLRFEEACFVPSPVLFEGESLESEQAQAQAWQGMEELQRAKRNASNWRSLCEENGSKDNSQLCLNVAAAFEHLRDKYANQRYGMRSEVDVLVTGSRELVGGTMLWIQQAKPNAYFVFAGSSNSQENNYSNARDLSQEALWRLQLAAAQSQQIYVEQRPPSAFSGLVDYAGYPHINTVTSSLSQQSFGQLTPLAAAQQQQQQPLTPHEMLQAAQRYGTLRKSKQPPLPPQRREQPKQQ